MKKRKAAAIIRDCSPPMDFKTYKKNVLSNLKMLGFSEVRVEGDKLILGDVKPEWIKDE